MVQEENEHAASQEPPEKTPEEEEETRGSDFPDDRTLEEGGEGFALERIRVACGVRRAGTEVKHLRDEHHRCTLPPNGKKHLCIMDRYGYRSNNVYWNLYYTFYSSSTSFVSLYTYGG